MMAALLQKIRGDHTTWVGAREAFAAATMGGATAIGFGDSLGAVEVGRIADLAVYRLDRIPFTPPNHPLPPPPHPHPAPTPHPDSPPAHPPLPHPPPTPPPHAPP